MTFLKSTKAKLIGLWQTKMLYSVALICFGEKRAVNMWKYKVRFYIIFQVIAGANNYETFF